MWPSNLMWRSKAWMKWARISIGKTRSPRIWKSVKRTEISMKNETSWLGKKLVSTTRNSTWKQGNLSSWSQKRKFCSNIVIRMLSSSSISKNDRTKLWLHKKGLARKDRFRRYKGILTPSLTKSTAVDKITRFQTNRTEASLNSWYRADRIF